MLINICFYDHVFPPKKSCFLAEAIIPLLFLIQRHTGYSQKGITAYDNFGK